jgi:hypothetical protein
MKSRIKPIRVTGQRFGRELIIYGILDAQIRTLRNVHEKVRIFVRRKMSPVLGDEENGRISSGVGHAGYKEAADDRDHEAVPRSDSFTILDLLPRVKGLRS